MSPNPPNIADNARFGICDAASILGITRHTLLRSVKENRIQFTLAKNGLKRFTGRQLKKYWNEN